MSSFITPNNKLTATKAIPMVKNSPPPDQLIILKSDPTTISAILIANSDSTCLTFIEFFYLAILTLQVLATICKGLQLKNLIAGIYFTLFISFTKIVFLIIIKRLYAYKAPITKINVLTDIEYDIISK